jgi:hypothetical protein
LELVWIRTRSARRRQPKTARVDVEEQPLVH